MRTAVFKFRLVLLLSFFVLQLLLGNIWQLRITLATFLVALAVLSSTFLSIHFTEQAAQHEQLTPVSLSITGVKDEAITRSEAEQLSVYYETLLAKQPEHRDLLLNLALLYSALDNKTAAQTKWDQARRLDPNHVAFTQ